MRTLINSSEYSQFGLVGSGVQRKVDRLTLGVQTVCKHVQPELSHRYQDEVRERVHRVDPLKQVINSRYRFSAAFTASGVGKAVR